jgi:hypothetical protein
VMIHVGDPVALFDPVDETNERWEELHQNPEWAWTSPGARHPFNDLRAASPPPGGSCHHPGSRAQRYLRPGGPRHRLSSLPSILVPFSRAGSRQRTAASSWPRA